jgi:DNA-dependent RNA polymerase auxiliary subunit epsilon
MKFSLLIKLIKENKKCNITVTKYINDDQNKIFINLINKFSESSNKEAIIPFINDEDLNILTTHTWKIINIEFILTEQELLDYYKTKENGANTLDIKENWPHISMTNIGIPQFNLLLNKQILKTFNSKYVYADLLEKSVNLYKQKILGHIIEREQELQETKTPQSIPEKSKTILSKVQKSECRKTIISKATKKDLYIKGFKPEFIEQLSNNEKEYISELNQFKIKLMMAEIEKKCSTM